MKDRFYIYITTCLVNGKKYVGQHVTREETIQQMLKDRYLGSGTALINAINKHGRKKFKKEIIKVFDSQKKADLFEIEYIENNNVLNNPNHWYNLSCGGQYTRGNYHGEQISKIMKVVCSTPEYRVNHGWLSVEEREAKRLRGMRIYLINSLRAVKNIKLKEEKQMVADECGFKTYSAYITSQLHKTEYRRNKLYNLNKYQRTPEGREAMSKARRGIVPKGRGKYTTDEFNMLFTEKNLTNKIASEILNCHRDTISLMRRGYQIVKGVRVVRYVKDEYYESLK